MKWIFVAASILFSAQLAAQTREEVGDLDSFNRNVTWLGLASLPTVRERANCTGLTRCTQPNPATQAASFSHVDVAAIKLPPRSTNSLVCSVFPTTLSFEFENKLAFVVTGTLDVAVTATIHNSLLDDPALIDPGTGAPFNGKLSVPLPLHSESQQLAPGEKARKVLRLTRDCLGGVISKNNLVAAYGLTAAQADQFFRNEINVSYSVSGSTVAVWTLDFTVGARQYGDRR